VRVDVIVDVVVEGDGDGDGENVKQFNSLNAIDPAPATRWFGSLTATLT
jgi:hypothetical protein